MNPDVVALLGRHYGYDRRARAKLGPLTALEQARLTEAGYAPDTATVIAHDDAMVRLREAAERLTHADVSRAFLAGLTSHFPRGRQPIMSYAFARLLPVHEASSNGARHCLACGLPIADSVDPVDRELRFYLGWSWNELPHHYVIDLETFDPAEIPAAAVDQGRALLRELLRVAATQPPATTPGKLDRAIAQTRLLPHVTDKYKRYGILSALAETGVLPNDVIAPSWRAFSAPPERWTASGNVKGSPRSDVTLPLAGWRGALGVDWDAACALFGVERPA